MKKLFIIASLIVALFAQAQVTNTVMASWNPSQPYISYYQLYYGPSSGNYTNITNAGASTNVTIKLINSSPVGGIRYYFAVTAVSSNGLESAYSSEVLYVTPFVPPTSPTNLRVVGP